MTRPTTRGRPITKENAKAVGRRGGLAKAAAWRAERAPPQPYAGTMLDAMDVAGMVGPSWGAWRVFWKAVDHLPMTPAELEVFQRHTGRSVPPQQPVREVFLIVGRRGGKSRSAALRAIHAAASRDFSKILAPGERAVVSCLAADRAQARNLLRYVRGLCQLPAFAPLIKRTLRDSVDLLTGCTVEVHSASWRTTRGYTLAGVIADELAFWRSEESGANPDAEVLDALRPGLATVPDALLLGCSTPYAPKGELFVAWQRHFGRDDSDVLVWVAPTLAMNSALDVRVVERAMEADPIAAASEYMAEWRRDVESFLDREAIRAVTIPERRELPPMAGVLYRAFVDPSGGSQDAFTLGIAHSEDGDRAVLDLVREVRPPFSPEQVVAEYSATLQAYRVATVTGDRYAGEWPRERFQVHGIRYEPSERVKSELYREVLPLVNAGRVELLDVPRLAAQFAGLERRVSRGGKDSIDHGPGGHDDLANVAAGALLLAMGRAGAGIGSCQVRMG